MLTGPLLLPPVVLAVLLLLSGASKVRHTEATRSAFAQLRLPRSLTGSAAPRALPWAEIALAGALLVAPPPFAVPAALLALLVFLAYLVVIARALTFDHPVTCGCFGELGLGEVTRRTLVRNALLVLLAGLTVWSATAPTSVVARLLGAGASTWVWFALLVLVGATLLTTFGGTKGEPLTPPVRGGAGAGAGAPEDAELDYRRQPLPFASLIDDEGISHSLTDLTRQGAQLLVFVSPGCAPCAAPIAQIPQWATDLGPVRVRGVVAAPIEATLSVVPELDGHLLHDPQATTTRIFGTGTPGAVLLGMDGLLAGGPVEGSDAVLEFVEDVRAELVDSGVISDAR
ncbi:TlpA family protein disulfide reductase [Janibacter sp. GS2]|uniref:TlpA family protein disulfide reductase n=1 Tax=Janibacter sp. GS2 TaxID=3442646 RepID=UPI003EC0F3FF